MKILEWDRKSYDMFMLNSSENTVFSQTIFLECYGHDVRYLKCVKGNEVIAGFAFVNQQNGILRRMPFQVYSSPVFKRMTGLKTYRKNEMVFKALNTFSEFFFLNYSEVDLVFQWNIFDMRPFEWLNYHEREKGFYNIHVEYTSHLDITTPEDVSGYNQGRKSDLKRAEKASSITYESQDIDILELLYEKTFNRQGIDVTEETKLVMKRICRHLLKSNHGRMFFTQIKKKIVAVSFFVHDQTNAYYLIGATDPIFRQYGVGTKNLFDAFQILNSKLGVNNVDFVGVNSPDRGNYKLSFGGAIIPYFVVNKVKSMG